MNSLYSKIKICFFSSVWSVFLHSFLAKIWHLNTSLYAKPTNKTIYYMPRVSIQHFKHITSFSKIERCWIFRTIDCLAKSSYDQLIHIGYIQRNQMCSFDFHQKHPKCIIINTSSTKFRVPGIHRQSYNTPWERSQASWLHEFAWENTKSVWEIYCIHPFVLWFQDIVRVK